MLVLPVWSQAPVALECRMSCTFEGLQIEPPFGSLIILKLDPHLHHAMILSRTLSSYPSRKIEVLYPSVGVSSSLHGLTCIAQDCT